MPFLIVMDRFHMTMMVYQNNEKASILVYQKKKGIGARNDSFVLLAHLRYIKILTCLRGIRVKIRNFHDSIFAQFPEKRLDHKEKETKYRKMTRKAQSHVRILKCKYRTWAII